jgi:hypothetical protein
MSDASLAARLLSYGMDHRKLPADDRDYAELLERWATDPNFKVLVRDIAMGLQIEVLEANAAGLMICPTSESPFRWDRRDYDRRVQGSPQQRLLHGLAQVGIAACCFPTEYDLTDGSRREVNAERVERLITTASERLRAERGEVDVRADESGLEEAWRLWLGLPVGGTQRDTVNTRTGIVRRALRVLEELGLLRPVSGQERRYRTTERYRVQVRELAAQEAYRLLVATAVRNT